MHFNFVTSPLVAVVAGRGSDNNFKPRVVAFASTCIPLCGIDICDNSLAKFTNGNFSSHIATMCANSGMKYAG